MNKTIKQLIYSIAYSVQRNVDFIDFSGIQNKSTLEFRYLMKNILSLKEYYDNLKKKENKDE